MKERYRDRKVVYTDGTFDLLHYNHMAFLRAARELGDYLVVGVVSDRLCQTYKRLPILTQEERLRTVRELGIAEEAFLLDGPFSAEVMEGIIETYNVAAVVYAGEQYDSYYGAATERGIMHRWPYREGINSSQIIDRIRARKTI